MQGYYFIKDQHLPVEHLVFQTAEEHVSAFLEADHQIWTLGEAFTSLFDHIPFLSKEVWVNDNHPGEIHVIFIWESMESWHKVGNKDLQEKLCAAFDAAFPHPYQLVRCIHEDENFGLHLYSRFERI